MSARPLHIRIFSIIILSITGIVLLLFLLIDNSNIVERDNICIRLGHNEVEYGHWYNDTLYLFIPSFLNVDKLIVDTEKSSKFIVNDDKPHSDLSRMELDSVYSIHISDSNKYICIRKSDNIPTLFIHTQSSGNNIIHQTRLYTELITTKLVMPDGSVQYQSTTDTIQSRGNTSWDADKKPYMISLSSSHEMLNMNQSTKWLLIASPYDETCLRNKVVYDYSKRIDFEWSPSCEYIELYLNNEYRGLYLLTEKVEMSENRLQPRPESMNFLCTMDLLSRCQNKKNKEIVTKVGQGIKIRYPYICNPNEYHFIDSLINQLDNSLMNNDTCEVTESSNLEMIDIDSWARKYLIDEIFGNFDAGLASNFFYCRKNDDDEYKFYGGPVWDYDGSLNLNTVLPQANSFLVRRSWRSSSPNARTPWYNALYKDSIFNSRVRELYFNEFRPCLDSLINEQSNYFIPKYYSKYEKGIANNNLRWYESLHTPYVMSYGVKTSLDIVHYLRTKVAFLDSAWTDGNEYCLVQIEHEPGTEYYCYSVSKGEHFVIPFDTSNSYWINKNNNAIYTDTSIIKEDTQLLIKYKSNKSAPVNPESTVSSMPFDGRIIVIGISFILFAMISAYLFYRYKQNQD